MKSRSFSCFSAENISVVCPTVFCKMFILKDIFKYTDVLIMIMNSLQVVKTIETFIIMCLMHIIYILFCLLLLHVIALLFYQWINFSVHRGMIRTRLSSKIELQIMNRMLHISLFINLPFEKLNIPSWYELNESWFQQQLWSQEVKQKEKKMFLLLLKDISCKLYSLYYPGVFNGKYICLNWFNKE